jgi:type IV pilus assembly protein PilO
MKRVWIIGWVIMGTILIGLYGWWGVRPLLQTFLTQRHVLLTKEKELQEARNLLIHYPEVRERAIRIQMDAQRLEERIPQQAQIPALLKEVTRAATECNIQQFTFAPLPAIDKSRYLEQPLQLSVTCGYHALGLFLSRLALAPRLIVTTMVSIKSNDPSGQQESIRADVTVVTYVRK